MIHSTSIKLDFKDETKSILHALALCKYMQNTELNNNKKWANPVFCSSCTQPSPHIFSNKVRGESYFTHQVNPYSKPFHNPTIQS